MKTRQIVLETRPHGLPSVNNLRIEDKVLDKIGDREILLKSWYISVDPYMRGRMNNTKSYSPPFQVNQPIKGGVVAKVIESRCDSLAAGDIVLGNLPWATYSIESEENLRKIDPLTAPPSYNLGILGMPGLTAYFGMMDIGKPEAGETVVVSGAAGAVGIVAGQIAKIAGCKVVGIAGSDDKCKLLKEQFGFDETINYKTAKKIRKSVATACKNGVDVYYDNVGGIITQGVFENLNFHSRVVLCGQISQYNNVSVLTVPDILPGVLTKSIIVQGFIVTNYRDRFEEGLTQLFKWVKERRLNYKETIIEGFDNLPEAFIGLFSGINQGKMLVEIAEK
jgi:NADPH:quinone reductase